MEGWDSTKAQIDRNQKILKTFDFNLIKETVIELLSGLWLKESGSAGQIDKNVCLTKFSSQIKILIPGCEYNYKSF